MSVPPQPAGTRQQGRPAVGAGLAACGTLLLALALVALGARPAFALRPFDGTDATVAEPHLFELEMSPLTYQREGPDRRLVSPQITLNWGTGAGFELGLEGRNVLVMSSDSAGVSPKLEEPAFNMKKVIRAGVLQKSAGASIATEESFLLPFRGVNHLGVSASLIVSQPILKAHSMLHCNVVGARTQALEWEEFGSIILTGPEDWAIRPCAEFSIEKIGADRGTGYLAGIIWQTRQGLTMDAALKSLAAPEGHGLEIRSGFTWHMQFEPPKAQVSDGAPKRSP